MKYEDLPVAKFSVACDPGGPIYVSARSFEGATKAAKDACRILKRGHQRGFMPKFLCWERGAFDPKRTGQPPKFCM